MFYLIESRVKYIQQNSWKFFMSLNVSNYMPPYSFFLSFFDILPRWESGETYFTQDSKPLEIIEFVVKKFSR